MGPTRAVGDRGGVPHFALVAWPLEAAQRADGCIGLQDRAGAAEQYQRGTKGGSRATTSDQLSSSPQGGGSQGSKLCRQVRSRPYFCTVVPFLLIARACSSLSSHGSQREHPGRISVTRPPAANAAPRSKRPLRHGDPELRLRVEGLNGFAAMLATMKEMGYDSDEDEEAAEQTTEVDVETGAAPTGVSSAALTDVVVEGVAEEGPAPSKQPAVGVPTRPSHQSRFWVFAIIAVVIAACIAAVVVVLVVVVDDGNGNVPPSRLRRLALLRLT